MNVYEGHFLRIYEENSWYLVHVSEGMNNQLYGRLKEEFGARARYWDSISEVFNPGEARWDYPAPHWLAFRDRDDALRLKLSLV